MGAFDPIRPPEPDLIDTCVHCGFCLPTCPTYVLWGEEMDSPRGRILLMRAAHEEGPDLLASQVDAWDNCLGCMACVTACPSGVQYDKLIEDTRAQVERNWERTPADRLWRRALFELFPHPGRLRALAPLMAAQHALTDAARAAVRSEAAAPAPGQVARARRARRRLAPLLGRAGERLGRRFPRQRELLRVAPRTAVRDAWRRLPQRTPARGARRGTVGFMQGCVQRVFFGDVNAATVAVLAAEGFDVEAPRLPRCCGALQLHTGDAAPARALGRQTIEAFERYDAVVVNAAGCGSAMKDYGHLFRDDPAWASRAAAFSAKVRDVSELLAEHEPVAPRHPLPLTVAYHDACHLAHAQGVRAAPRALLSAIPELELREPAEPELCCGSAGLYNLLEPEPAAALGARKARNLLDTDAQLVAAGNPGCALQIAAHARALGRELRVLHPIELLAASIAGRQVADLALAGAPRSGGSAPPGEGAVPPSERAARPSGQATPPSDGSPP